MKTLPGLLICFLLPLFIQSCIKAGGGGQADTVTADFTYTGGNCAPPCMVTFTNTSSHASTYQWDFGDGTNSTDKNPVKTYASGGTFTVTLTATGNAVSASVSKQVTIQQPPRPAVTLSILSPASMTIYLPNNCSRSFTITNSGQAGSTLNYNVYDNGALGGFLDVANAAGSLSAGMSATITVTIKPQFVNSSPSLVGSTLVLDVATPQASNYIHIPVAVYIRGIAEEAQGLLGSWTGTWNGISFGGHNAGQPSPTTAVNGTWILNLTSIDASGTVPTGTLTWNGVDAYWSYTFDGFGNITSATPVPFIPDRTFNINASNAYINLPVPGSTCEQFRLMINVFPNSSYGVYGPTIGMDLNLSSNLLSSGSGYSAWPYAPTYTGNLSVSQSNGGMGGHKL